jgi:signal transduction histidine kinase
MLTKQEVAWPNLTGNSLQLTGRSGDKLMAKYEILLLGDGSHLFRTMAWVLEYKGLSVQASGSPEAALEALVKKNYDLIIAKLSMEDMDNLDVLKRAKRMNPEVKVMVVSGNHEVTLPLEAYQIEIDDYILMPVSPTELWRRVNACLENLEVVDLTPVSAPAASAADINERVLNRMMVMFHDIRGSMVSTAAALRLLSRGTYGELGQTAQGKIQEVAQRVDKLINLTEEFVEKAFARTAPAEPEREMLDLSHDVVDPVLEELTEEFRDHHVTLENRLAFYPGSIPVKANQLWLKSVFRNLLNNALKHGDPGGTIVIDWKKQGDGCRLNVYNSGKPVPEELRSMLFSNFTPRLRQARGDGAGLGLGLYLSRDIIRNYGGDIWYEPKTDGSNFVVTLPNR